MFRKTTTLQPQSPKPSNAPDSRAKSGKRFHAWQCPPVIRQSGRSSSPSCTDDSATSPTSPASAQPSRAQVKSTKWRKSSTSANSGTPLAASAKIPKNFPLKKQFFSEKSWIKRRRYVTCICNDVHDEEPLVSLSIPYLSPRLGASFHRAISLMRPKLLLFGSSVVSEEPKLRTHARSASFYIPLFSFKRGSKKLLCKKLLCWSVPDPHVLPVRSVI